MKLDFLVFCDKAYNADNGKHMLIGLFDKINVNTDVSKEKPATHPLMSIAYKISELTSKVNGKKLRFRFTNNDDVDIKGETEIKLNEGSDSVYSVIEIPLLKISIIKDFVATIAIDSEEMGESNLKIVKL